jgi:hypothetical protein
MLKVVRGLRFKVLVEDIRSFVGKTMVLPVLHPASGIRVDFIFSFSPYERQAITRALLVPMGGYDVRFATAEDLVIHKIFAGRKGTWRMCDPFFWKIQGLTRHTYQTGSRISIKPFMKAFPRVSTACSPDACRPP